MLSYRTHADRAGVDHKLDFLPVDSWTRMLSEDYPKNIRPRKTLPKTCYFIQFHSRKIRTKRKTSGVRYDGANSDNISVRKPCFLPLKQKFTMTNVLHKNQLTWYHCPTCHTGHAPRLHRDVACGLLLASQLTSDRLHSTWRSLDPSPQVTEH